MSEIQALASRVQDITDSIARWNNAYVVLVALTVVLAGLVFVSQFVVIRKGKALEVAQGNLASAKEAQAVTDSKTKDVKIADALGAAALAGQRAAEANLRAEQEKLERIKLEEDLSPRLFNGATEATKRMSSFRGTAVLLEYSLDLECKATAERIAFVLSEAGWNITPRPNNDPNAVFFEGVVVGYVGQGGVGVNPVPVAIRLPFDVAPPIKTAGEVLLDELNNAGIDAHTTPGIGRIGEAVYVYVGFKPSPESKRELKIEREIERITLDSFGKEKPPDLTDLIEQLKKLRRSGAGGRLQLPAH
ncbi:MAG: hypothetical protein ABSB35_01630 [Bryobacteraceae bacterium]